MSKQHTAKRRGRPKNSDGDSGHGQSTILALDRGLRALVFLADSGGATLTEVSRNANTPVATTHRILSTLQQRGMAKLDTASGKWEVGPQAYRVGAAYQDSYNLLEVAGPVMQEMSKETGETSNLAIEDNGELVYLFQVESNNPIRASLKNGATSYFHTSGVGKVIMAHMDEQKLDSILKTQEFVRQTPNSVTSKTAFITELLKIRCQGWAMDDEERFVGMRCIAAPVFDPVGSIIAGVSISGPSSRFPDDLLAGLANTVVLAAKSISQRLSSRSE